MKASLAALRANKVRTFLTTLGVIIGVFSVTTLISLGRGVQNYITDQFEALGSNLLFIAPGNAGFGDDPAKSFTNNKLSQTHLDLIDSHASEVILYASPYIVTGFSAEYKTVSFYSELTGMNAEGFNVINYEVDLGRAFNRSEERAHAAVVLIGSQVKDELFSNQNPLDQKIEVNGNKYTVIGVIKPKGVDYDDQIIFPYTTLMRDFDIDVFASIAAKMKPGVAEDVAIKQLELALLRDLDPDDFTVMSQSDLLESINQVLQALTLGLGAIAAISLLVGGIGIMNIMLVSVTERTKEIGLRKALGATSRKIASQFLMESITVSMLGGTIGLALGYLASLVARAFIRTEMPLYAVFLSLGFSVFVGVLFGTYPAYKASKKNPIEALNFE